MSNNVEPQNGKRIFISPLARKMAEDKNFDITRIQGTGGNNRITKLDIQRVEEQGYDIEAKNEDMQSKEDKNTKFNSANVGEGLNPMRKRIAQEYASKLGRSLTQLTLHRKVDLRPFVRFQKQTIGELENANQDTKLTVTALLAKAIVLALKDYGAMNARYENGQLTEYDDVHLGVATSLDEGLMVPVINNAGTKSIGALAKEIKS